MLFNNNDEYLRIREELDTIDCFCQNRGAEVDKQTNNISKYSDPIEGRKHYAEDLEDMVEETKVENIDVGTSHLDLINKILEDNNAKPVSFDVIDNENNTCNCKKEDDSCKCNNEHQNNYDEQFEILGQALITVLTKLENIERKLK